MAAGVACSASRSQEEGCCSPRPACYVMDFRAAGFRTPAPHAQMQIIAMTATMAVARPPKASLAGRWLRGRTLRAGFAHARSGQPAHTWIRYVRLLARSKPASCAPAVVCNGPPTARSSDRDRIAPVSSRSASVRHAVACHACIGLQGSPAVWFNIGIQSSVTQRGI